MTSKTLHLALNGLEKSLIEPTRTRRTRQWHTLELKRMAHVLLGSDVNRFCWPSSDSNWLQQEDWPGVSTKRTFVGP